MRLFFVMGAPKSGTTWLQNIMNAHPQVSCFGEGHFVDQVAMPLQTVLQNYNRQLAMVSALVYSDKPHYAPLLGDDIVGLIRTMIVALMRRAGPKPQALWWGDKTPAYSNQLELLNRLFPASRFIDVVRDPRDTAVSVLYHGLRSGVITDVERDIQGRRDLIAHATGRWLAHVMLMDRAAERWGERLLQVRYRDLVDEPRPELRRLFTHLEGVAVTEDILSHVLKLSSFTAMSGGRTPGQADDTSFFRSGTNGRYVEELRPEELVFIEDRLGKAMQRLGLIG